MLNKFANQKSLAAIFLFAFAAVFLAQMTAAALLLFVPAPAQAQYSINLQVPIPAFVAGKESLVSTIKFDYSTAPIAQYIQLIYNFAVGAVGIIAAVVLMIGGLMWITASLTGLVLVLASYLLLNQINPQLVNLQSDLIGKPFVPTQTEDTNTAIQKLFGTQCSWQTPVNSEMAHCSEWLGNTWTDGKNCTGTRLLPPQAAVPQMCCCPPANNTPGSGSGTCTCSGDTIDGVSHADCAGDCSWDNDSESCLCGSITVGTIEDAASCSGSCVWQAASAN